MAALSNVSDFVPCPHCGIRVRRGMIRCRECGGVIAGEEDFVLASGVRASAPKRHCHRCGAELESGATDCPQCASAMLDELLNKPAPEQPLPELTEISSLLDGAPLLPASIEECRLRPAALRARPELDETEPDLPPLAPRPENRPAGPHGGKKGRRTVARRTAGRNRKTADEDALEYLTDDSSDVETANDEPLPGASANAAAFSTGRFAERAEPTMPSSDTSAACSVLALSLASGDVNLRCQAATALGSLGNPEALAPLERLLVDPEIRVRRAVAEALIQLGHPKGEALRAIAERHPVGGSGAASSMPAVSRKTRPKREWDFDFAPEMKATLLKGTGIAAAALVLCSGVFLLNGSSGGPKLDPKFQMDLKDAYPAVQFKLQMAGKDVEEAIVTLHNKKGDQNRKIVSNFDSETNYYRFITQEGSNKKGGVPEGDYTVTAKSGRKSKTQIPAKYADPANSGFTLTVKPGDNPLPPFELTP